MHKKGEIFCVDIFIKGLAAAINVNKVKKNVDYAAATE